jgi:hypothetical protein
MKKIINNLRQKPPHVRKMVAFGTSATVAGVIGIVWFSNLVVVGLDTSSEKAKNADNGPSPISMLIDGAGKLFQSTGNELASVSSVFNFMQSTTTGQVDISKSAGAIVPDESSAIGVKREIIVPVDSGTNKNTGIPSDAPSDVYNVDGSKVNTDSGLDSSY